MNIETSMISDGAECSEANQVTVTMRVERYFRYCHLVVFNILLSPSCLHPFSASMISVVDYER